MVTKSIQDTTVSGSPHRCPKTTFVTFSARILSTETSTTVTSILVSWLPILSPNSPSRTSRPGSLSCRTGFRPCSSDPPHWDLHWSSVDRSLRIRTVSGSDKRTHTALGGFLNLGPSLSLDYSETDTLHKLPSTLTSSSRQSSATGVSLFHRGTSFSFIFYFRLI